MPKVVNYKWAPISSMHSIAINNEGRITLKISHGVLQYSDILQNAVEGPLYYPAVPKPHKVAQKALRVPTGIYDLLGKTPVLETTCFLGFLELGLNNSRFHLRPRSLPISYRESDQDRLPEIFLKLSELIFPRLCPDTKNQSRAEKDTFRKLKHLSTY